MLLPRLFLNRDTELDWLLAIEFGRVDDGQPPDCWTGITEQIGLLHDAPDGRPVGFAVQQLSRVDPEDPKAAAIWRGPRFDAPLLGLSDVCAGEIIVAAKAYFGDRDSHNRTIFHAAVAAEGEEAVRLWRECLEAGDSMAHFSLGYTLFELGRFPEAYRHLRHYTEIAPAGAWNWCWYGYVAEAMGEDAEAVRAYRRAVDLEGRGRQETDAAERLSRLWAD